MKNIAPVTLKLNLQFAKPGYIEHPYWPEMYERIEIDKKSGVNRARTDANRRRALEAYLSEINMTLDQYKALCDAANKPFHTYENGNIYIPADKVIACLVHANNVAPAKNRIPNLRTALNASDFVTSKTEPDGEWKRFAVVNLGNGAKASNQRGFRSNAYISNFNAVGTIQVEPVMVDPEAVNNLLRFAGRVAGIGACKKMGWGRFTVEE